MLATAKDYSRAERTAKEVEEKYGRMHPATDRAWEVADRVKVKLEHEEDKYSSLESKFRASTDKLKKAEGDRVYAGRVIKEKPAKKAK